MAAADECPEIKVVLVQTLPDVLYRTQRSTKDSTILLSVGVRAKWDASHPEMDIAGLIFGYLGYDGLLPEGIYLRLTYTKALEIVLTVEDITG
jgi:hypothetical protein